MVPGYSSTTAGNSAGSLRYSFTPTSTTSISTDAHVDRGRRVVVVFNNFTLDRLDPFAPALSRLARLVEELKRDLDLWRERCIALRETEKPRFRPLIAPPPCVALNTGMHIRRMRASCGLARARA